MIDLDLFFGVFLCCLFSVIFVLFWLKENCFVRSKFFPVFVFVVGMAIFILGKSFEVFFLVLLGGGMWLGIAPLSSFLYAIRRRLFFCFLEQQALLEKRKTRAYLVNKCEAKKLY